MKIAMASLETSPAGLVRFALVGLSGTLAYYAVLWLFVEALGLPLMLSTTVAFMLVTVANYVLHHSWTFRSEAVHGKAFPRFLVMTAIAFCINWSLMSVGTIRFNYLWVQGVSIALIVLWNFIIGSYWVFRCRAADEN
jgi:putative flippase GtrA